VLVAYQRLHSPWAISLVLLADLLPGVFTSFAFGSLADRLPRRPLAVGADLLRCGAFAAIALVPSISTTIGFALLAGLGTAMFRPVLASALPALMPEGERDALTTLYGGLESSSMIAGPALAGIVLLFASPEVLLLLNAATFLISALVLLGTDLGQAPAPVVEAGEAAVPWRQRLSDDFLALRRDGEMAALILVSGALAFASGAINVAEPILAKGALGAGDSGFALLLTGYGAGLVAGSYVSARRAAGILALRHRWLWGIALMGVGMLAAARSPSLAFALGAFALTGLGNTLVIIPEVRLIQEMGGARKLGSLFGARDASNNTALVIAFVAAGALLPVAGVRALFAVSGGLTLLILILARRAFQPGAARVAQASSSASATSSSSGEEQWPA
jgi:MFS family permease